MKFILLLKKVLKLLLNKHIFFLFIGIVFIWGCEKKSSDQMPESQQIKNDSGALLKSVNTLLHTEASFILVGNFSGDSTRQVTAVNEVNKREEKITFNLIEIKNNQLEKRNETGLLAGALKDCKIEKINLPGIDNDLIYYNSQIYFMGSGSGEVFAYIIDFKTKKTYYAHLVSESKKHDLLFISENENQEIRKFFIDSFRKDYPAYKLTIKDRVLN
jgi:hypothetical protein